MILGQRCAICRRRFRREDDLIEIDDAVVCRWCFLPPHGILPEDAVTVTITAPMEKVLVRTGRAQVSGYVEVLAAAVLVVIFGIAPVANLVYNIVGDQSKVKVLSSMIAVPLCWVFCYWACAGVRARGRRRDRSN